MSNDNLLDSIKENLNGRPGQPMVLGVCSALAKRFDQETWLIRAIAIVLGVFWTGLALIAYVILGLVLPETEARTKGVFKGAFIALQEIVEKLIDGCRDLFDSNDRGNRRGQY